MTEQAERDPRVNPRAGDVLRWDRQTAWPTRTIYTVVGSKPGHPEPDGDVRYTVGDGLSYPAFCASLGHWRVKAAGFEVVTVAGESAE